MFGLVFGGFKLKVIRVESCERDRRVGRFFFLSFRGNDGFVFWRLMVLICSFFMGFVFIGLLVNVFFWLFFSIRCW